MTTLQKPARTTKTRTLRFTANTDDMSPTAGLLTIEVGTATDVYTVTEFATGHVGRGFVLSKLLGDGAGYTVMTCGETATCDCLAMSYRRGKMCKHAASVVKLIECGRL